MAEAKRVVDNLTPAEVLYILNMTGHERVAANHNYLFPTLGFLAAKGFIEADPNAVADEGLQLRLTREASNPIMSFRDYEKVGLDAINHRNIRELYAAVTDYAIRENLFGQGFLLRHEEQKRFLLWHYTDVKYFRTGVFDQAVRELEEGREWLQTSNEADKWARDCLCLCLGMPSLGLTDRFLKLLPEIAPHVRAAQQTANYVIGSVLRQRYMSGLESFSMPSA